MRPRLRISSSLLSACWSPNPILRRSCRIGQTKSLNQHRHTARHPATITARGSRTGRSTTRARIAKPFPALPQQTCLPRSSTRSFPLPNSARRSLSQFWRLQAKFWRHRPVQAFGFPARSFRESGEVRRFWECSIDVQPPISRRTVATEFLVRRDNPGSGSHSIRLLDDRPFICAASH